MKPSEILVRIKAPKYMKNVFLENRLFSNLTRYNRQQNGMITSQTRVENIQMGSNTNFELSIAVITQ